MIVLLIACSFAASALVLLELRLWLYTCQYLMCANSITKSATCTQHIHLNQQSTDKHRLLLPKWAVMAEASFQIESFYFPCRSQHFCDITKRNCAFRCKCLNTATTITNSKHQTTHNKHTINSKQQ